MDLFGCFIDGGTVTIIRLVAVRQGVVQVFDFKTFK